VERLPSDHPAVETYRGRVGRRGGTRRPCLRLPDDTPVEAGDHLRVTLDGDDGHAVVAGDADGRYLAGVYADRAVARTGDGTNRLVEWCRTAGFDPGRTVAVDELDPGHHYGLRPPGERVVYGTPDRPADSLVDIAEQVGGDDA